MTIAQPLSSLLVHLIFSTKDRYPFLAESELIVRTHGYLGGILREADCPSLVIGGTATTRTPFSASRAHSTSRSLWFCGKRMRVCGDAIGFVIHLRRQSA
jgi:hypothetical protein